MVNLATREAALLSPFPFLFLAPVDHDSALMNNKSVSVVGVVAAAAAAAVVVPSLHSHASEAGNDIYL